MAKVSISRQRKALDKYGSLDDLDQKILTALLTYPSITDQEIANLNGVSRSLVNKRKNAPRFKAEYDLYLMAPLELLRDSMTQAARVIARTLKSKNERLRYDAACRILQSEGVLKRELDPTSVKLSASFAVINRVNGDKTVLEAKFTPNEEHAIESGESED